MSKINKITFKKIALIYFISEFQKGVYSEFRLHKVMYFSQKKQIQKLFSFKKHYYGQFSDDLRKCLYELVDLDIIKMNIYNYQCAFFMNRKFETLYNNSKKILKKCNLRLIESIKEAIKEYGYLTESQLYRKAYNVSEMKRSKHRQYLVKEDLNRDIEIDFDSEIIEDLELSLNPSFVKPIKKLVKGLDKIKLTPEIEERLFNK